MIGQPPIGPSVGRTSKWTRMVDAADEIHPARRSLLFAFILMFIGVAMGVVGKMLLHQDIVTAVGVLASLIGMFFMAYPYLSPTRPKKHDIGTSPQRDSLHPVEPTKKLTPMNDIDFVPSVTERTTDLLKTPAARQSKP